MIYWYIISTLLYPSLSGFTEAYKLQERYSHSVQLNKDWHTLKLFESASAVNLGISIAVSSKDDFIEIAKKTFLSGVIYWIVYDFILEQKGYSGQGSVSQFNKITFLKIPLLIGAICVNIF
jgi:hypothetical protein